MKKTGAELACFALEQIGVTHTFGIPGVHNTELYDELNKSTKIQPVLVTHEGGGAFMADAVSRTSVTDKTLSKKIGTMLIVPAAGASHAASGIGEAFLDGIPMLVVSGGVRSDSAYGYQLHDMDQHAMLAPITKKTYKIEQHQEIIPTIYEAYDLAISGEPGPVFIEIPVNIQLDTGGVGGMPRYKAVQVSGQVSKHDIAKAVDLLLAAKRPGLFLGWGALTASKEAQEIAEILNAPVSTTLQGLSVFPANHPLHTGMSFGPAAVPAATKAFKSCDCMLAVGTRFGEIATGSFGVTVPDNLIHTDINPGVFNVNWPAKVTIEGDSQLVLSELLSQLKDRIEELDINVKKDSLLAKNIAKNKLEYVNEWLDHDSGERVNPAKFFLSLRESLSDDAYLVADDGNHTFLTAELMPIHTPGNFISPTDFNCMGYCVPATIATKMMHPNKQVVGIVGDGCFMMTCMEIITAAQHNLGAVFFVFNDGELSQISQAQEVPYNRKVCTTLGDLKTSGIAQATGAAFFSIRTNDDIDKAMEDALSMAEKGKPVIVSVNVDYSKQTRFTKGIVATNLKRLPARTAVRMVSRAVKRKITG